MPKNMTNAGMSRWSQRDSTRSIAICETRSRSCCIAVATRVLAESDGCLMSASVRRT